jgi:hypothetical protein
MIRVRKKNPSKETQLGLWTMMSKEEWEREKRKKSFQRSANLSTKEIAFSRSLPGDE